MSEMYQIDTGYYCAALIVENDIVVSAAPILKWTLNKQWKFLRLYLIRKGKITQINDKNDIL